MLMRSCPSGALECGRRWGRSRRCGLHGECRVEVEKNRETRVVVGKWGPGRQMGGSGARYPPGGAPTKKRTPRPHPRPPREPLPAANRLTCTLHYPFCTRLACRGEGYLQPLEAIKLGRFSIVYARESSS
ncbi:hypothetical protein BT67DRAFT_109515 [Trichocladium antarcticum]|uniref:Uncharacterized protein n=1 Tax=Trichocladium antarcticum TaxID=1450529 RepID=A0AAN6UR63_9PEZI|nr:hypothetical protein BT67DRAFT_109515 [Trichocladium antarcticum]